MFFFFSSRRRHTRLQGDWSSDVCSSDLPELGTQEDAQHGRAAAWLCRDHPRSHRLLRRSISKRLHIASPCAARAFALPSARASGLAFARYTGDDSACTASTRLTAAASVEGTSPPTGPTSL